MRGRSCYFYADEDDLRHLLEGFNLLGSYKYVQKRSEVDTPNLVLLNALQVLPLATATPDRPERQHSFLVFERDEEVHSNEISLALGGVRSVVDHNYNPNSLVLALGGDAGDRTLVMSDINTAGDTEKSLAMHAVFKKYVRSKSIKLGLKGNPTFLLPGALGKLKSGWRLAGGKSWSRSTDPVFTAGDFQAEW